MKMKIYQVNAERDKDNVLFQPYDFLEKLQGTTDINSRIYDCVFEGDVDCITLDDVYTKFNIDSPDGYGGRSLSVSDVVEIVEVPIAVGRISTSEGDRLFADPEKYRREIDRLHERHENFEACDIDKLEEPSVEQGYYFCDAVGFEPVEFDAALTKDNRGTISVVLVEPGKFARTEDINCSLEGMQNIVGGYIEAYYPFEEEVCIVCNDEGKINGMKPNRAVYGDDHEIMDIIAGPFFICDCSGESFGSLNDEQLKKYTEMYRYPENFFRINGELKAVQYEPRNTDRER